MGGGRVVTLDGVVADGSTGEDEGSPALAGTHGLQFRLRDVGGERESAGSSGCWLVEEMDK